MCTRKISPYLVQDSKMSALEFVRLMSPLVPRGKLAVRLHGVPLRDSEERMRKELTNAAASVGAHRTSGVVALDYHFAHGSSEQSGAQFNAFSNVTSHAQQKYRLMIICAMLVVVLGEIWTLRASVLCKTI